MEEWNQQRADWRSIDAMRQIAIEVQILGDDWVVFEEYAAGQNLTVNEWSIT